jgi:hypothetical protein
MASHLRPPKPGFQWWLKYQALTATQGVRACSNGAESGRFARVKGGTHDANSSVIAATPPPAPMPAAPGSCWAPSKILLLKPAWPGLGLSNPQDSAPCHTWCGPGPGHQGLLVLLSLLLGKGALVCLPSTQKTSSYLCCLNAAAAT